MPLSVITFDVFAPNDGQKILAREITESELTAVPRERGAGVKVDDVLRQAETAGIGPVFKQFIGVGQELGLYPRAWKTSIMFTPQRNRSRMLFTVWAQPVKGKIKTYVGRAVFAEFFPISERAVAKHLGREGWRHMTDVEAKRFMKGVRRLLEEIGPEASDQSKD